MNDLSPEQLQAIIEAALMAAAKPLSLDQLLALFDEQQAPSRPLLRETLQAIEQACEGRGFELVEVASGYRFQTRDRYAPWVSRLWEEKPQRYSRALLETLSIIAYRQPITRGEIEEIRGVAVSTHITKTLLEREWVRVIGHRDVPGKPAMYGTTRQFLDYFNLKNLADLPTLEEIRDLDVAGQEAERQLQLDVSVAEAEARAAAESSTESVAADTETPLDTPAPSTDDEAAAPPADDDVSSDPTLH